jgi:hypothetical protein
MEGQCHTCLSPVKRGRKYCKLCFTERVEQRLNQSRGDLVAVYGDFIAHKHIRLHSRSIFKSSKLEEKCEICSYSLHVEIAHIKPVSDFPHEATLAEMNDIENLVALCPTHHWEFDNGYLTVKGVQNPIKGPEQRFCVDCEKPISKNSTRCNPCNNMQREKIQWPPVEEIKNLIDSIGIKDTCQRLGVSRKSVRDRLKKTMI